MNDPGIQHKQTLTAAPGFGFDDAGECVPVVHPQESDAERLREMDEAQVARQAFVCLLARLLSGNADESKIAERALCMAYLLRDHLNCFIGINAPLTLEELGARIGVGKSGAYKIVKKLETEFANELKR